ncbi:hypothetical protein ACRCQW_34060, partial [Pseudomonas aeruginosa]
PAYSASAKVICFMGKLGEVKSGDFAKSGSLFQTFPWDCLAACLRHHRGAASDCFQCLTV